MATNFNENSIVSSGGFKPSSKDTPLDIRTRVETEQDIYEIPNPYIGMIVYVKDTGKRFEILTLKEVDTGLTTKNVVDTYKQFTVDLEEYAKIEDVPTKVSELENDRGYATERFVDSKIETINNTVNSNTNTINSKINTINSNINTVNSNINTINTEIDGIDSNIANLNTEIDNINTDLTNVSESIEGSVISVDSKEGYLKDIEIIGNTIQDTNNLADIRSVGDKLENQELYEIPVLSTNKNLLCKLNKGYIINSSDGQIVSSGETNSISDFIKVKPNTSYVYSSTDKQKVLYAEYRKDKTFIKRNSSSYTVTTSSETHYIIIQRQYTDDFGQLEEGTQSTPFEKHSEHKLTILSPVQLEKVGDVADRIICKDGVWGVEKNVGSSIFDGSETWAVFSDISSDNDLFFVCSTGDYSYITSTTPIISDKFKHNSKCVSQGNIGIRINGSSGVQLRIESSKLLSKDVVGFKNWLSSNPMLLKYHLVKPTFIPLPYEQQVKLRTFANKTNIHFECEIEPTLKASVPKSLGASVSSNTTQIDNLSKELEKINNLEESVTSEFISESDFTTVEETSNGYFEDVKLEGKTLVNLCKDIKTSAQGRRYVLNLNRNIKANTTYFIQFNSTVTDYSSYLYAEFNYADGTNNSSYVFKNIVLSSGNHIIKFITDKEISSIVFKVQGKDYENGARFVLNSVLILEGDHTQNPPEFFEGLKSVGQDVDEISVLSCNENLFDGKYFEKYNINADGGISFDDGVGNVTDFIRVLPNTTYSFTGITDNANTVAFYDINKKFISRDFWSPKTTPSNCYYIRVKYDTSLGGLFSVYIGNKEKPYTPHQSDKKRILYYNDETQTWEKPILREWDSIEKHSDGKYYYHKRSGEVVLDGSEDFYHSYGNNQSYKYYRLRVQSFVNEPALKNSLFINTYGFVNNEQASWASYDASGEYGNIIGGDSIYLTFDKSKLESPSANSVKKLLQANPTTIVYQLAEEKVYECTNLDLITYQNETNLLVKSGVLSPKVTLKVHQNITNIITILQNKVSVLENVFIQGLKQVLAGDMQSLAYTLYPEDFENIEQQNDPTDE